MRGIRRMVGVGGMDCRLVMEVGIMGMGMGLGRGIEGGGSVYIEIWGIMD
jgi:hypothetical protein